MPLNPDDSEQSHQNVGMTIVSGIYKYEGWKYKISGILSSIFGGFITLLGVILLLVGFKHPTAALFGLFFLIIGIVLLLLGSFYRKRAKILSQGKLL